MDAERFLRDHRKHVAQPGERHWNEGWANTPCPFCSGNPGNHLGHDGRDPWLCWRCGPHSSAEVVKTLLRLDSWTEAKQIRDSYAGKGRIVPSSHPLQRDSREEARMPRLIRPMDERQCRYLEKRRFRPDFLRQQWGLLGTGPTGEPPLRIIIPIHLHGLIVSWQARDVTGRAEKKYLACPKWMEALDHHQTLYGLDKVHGKACVLTEGVADVWRLGDGAVASFGQVVTKAQMLLLADMERVAVFLDPDAWERAERLAEELALIGVPEVEIWTCDAKDPGEMDQREADRLMRTFMTKQ